MMLDHLGKSDVAHAHPLGVRGADRANGTSLTRDLGGTASTDEFTNAVIARL